jgi:ApaG protein
VSEAQRSETVTSGVRVEVRSQLVPERCDPENGQWLFAYRVRISNEGAAPVRLLSRHWVIIDGRGRIEEVRGPGVVGKQPTLQPGETFEYTSQCPLRTSHGTMHGTYRMVRPADASTFEAEIAPFALGEPDAVH